MSGERVKMVGLVLVLAFVAGSYFKSDVYTRGEMMSSSFQLFEGNLCQGRPPQVRNECRATLAQALAPAKVSCMPAFHDLIVCQHPVAGSGSKGGCREEERKRIECLQTHLGPYGFSNEEVVRLLFKPKRLSPQVGPSVEVAAEGSGDGAGGQTKEAPGKTDSAGSKKEGAGDEESNLADGANVDVGKPKVVVEQESKKGEGSAR